MNKFSATSRFAPVTWSRERVRHVRWLALSLAVVAVLGAIPAGHSLLSGFQSRDASELHRWVHLMLFVAVLQMGFAGFMVLFADWSSMWTATIANLFFVGIYAGLFAIRVLAEPSNEVISFLQLDLEEAPAGKQAMWFMITIVMFVTQSFFTGRYARRWKRDR